MKKHLLSLLVLLLTTLSTHAYDFQSGDLYYNITGENTVEITYQYRSWEGTNYQGLTTASIPATVTHNGTTYSVTSIESYAFSNCSTLTTITIPNSVTSIGEQAFIRCSSLTSITIPNSVTSIESYAFSNCSSLTSITIPNSVTSIGERAFSGCTSLPIVNNLRYADTYLVEAVDKSLSTYTIKAGTMWIGIEAFKGCSSLTSITIPNSVTRIGDYAFCDCSSLTSITIPNSVTRIGDYAFCDCSSLTSITIPNSITSIGNKAFYGCSSLTSITIGNSVTSIGDYAFSGCSSLPVVDNLRYADTYLVEAVDESLSTYTIKAGTKWIGGSAFYGCSALTSITIPNSVTRIGHYAFRDCSSLTTITIPNSVTSIGEYAFGLCSSLTSLTIPNSVMSIEGDAFRGCTSLTSITIPNSVTSIGDYAFSWCSSLTSITIPNSVTSIGSYAFRSCSALTSVTIGNSVTSIGRYAFDDCSSLTSVVWNAKNCAGWSFSDYAPFYDSRSNITSFTFGEEVKMIPAYLCYDMSSLTSLTIPNSVTRIRTEAFYNCYALTSLTIGNSVTSIEGGAFRYCTSLTSVVWNAKNCAGWSSSNYEPFYDSRSNITSFTFGEEVKKIPEYLCDSMSSLTSVTIPNSVTSIGKSAFNGCSALTSITIPNSITSIGDNTFSGCSSITSITIPESVTSIEYATFEDCSALTSITIPNSVTRIGGYAFKDCSSLTSITIPNSVTSIGDDAFYGCSTLTTITIPNSVTSIGDNTFSGCSSLTSVVWNAKNCAGWRLSDYAPFYDSRSNITSFTFGEEVKMIPAYLCYGMSSLTSITIPNSVTSIGEWAFYNCSALTSITIPNSVTSIGSDAFRSCSALTSITIPNSVTSIGSDAFRSCSALTSITIPNSVTSIGEEAFYLCSSLTSITIGNSVTSIGSNAFKDCFTLTSVIWNAKQCAATKWETSSSYNKTYYYGPFANISSQITSFTIGAEVEAIPSYLCFGMKNLTSITIPNSVTSIGSVAFRSCSALTSITIPESVTSIGDYAFCYCSALTSVTSLSCTPPDCGSDVFYSTPSEKTLVVPNSSLNAYRETYPWNEFSSRERLFALSVQSSDTRMGQAQIDQDVDCDSVAIIAATSNYGYHFTQWIDGNTNNPRTIKFTQDTTFTAEFATNQYTLTTTTNYAERGTTRGDTVADYLSEVQVSATANYGYHFTQWSDGDTNNPRTISLTKNTNLVAQFDKNQYQCLINCDKDKGNSFINGIVTGNGQVTDFIVNLFDRYGDGWNGCKLTISDGEHTYDCTISSGSNASYEITNYGLPYTFYWTKGSYPSECSFEVICRNETISVSSLSTYETGDVIPISLPALSYYDYLSELELSVTPNYGYHFTQWSDGDTNNPRTITITHDTTFTAEFAPNQYALTTTANYAERGITLGDTVADYLSEVQVSATANYGYHFAQWSDGDTNNPRTIIITQDTTFTAEFVPNQYTLTTSSNYAERGTTQGDTIADYLSNLQVFATATLGYHFTQWSDGNTDNPRTIKLIQDTTLTAEFGLTYSGKCGDDLYWAYSNQEIKITGSGSMYNYTYSTMPWTLLRDSILTVRVGNNATSIGEYAFANTPKLAELHIGTNVEDIGANAFSGCKRLYDIYCYPTYPPFAETNSFANYNVYVYVPCENLRDYTLDVVWGEFKFIECIGSEDVEVSGNEVTVSPSYEDATFTWPVTDNADTYSLVITKDGVTFCTLVFNAQGQLVSIAFKPRRQNAPAAEGTTPATYAEMTANGFRFTVTGLDEGTAYAYTLTVRNAANTVLETYTGEFTTLSNTPTGISDSPDATETVSDKGAEELLRDGQVLIIRNGETYNMMGQRL